MLRNITMTTMARISHGYKMKMNTVNSRPLQYIQWVRSTLAKSKSLDQKMHI